MWLTKFVAWMLNCISGTRLYYRKPSMELVKVPDNATDDEGTAKNDIVPNHAPVHEDNDIHHVQIPIALTCALLISYVFIGIAIENHNAV